MSNKYPAKFADRRVVPLKCSVVAGQLKEAMRGHVTCECGLKMPLRYAYRCVYCGEWYCQTHAEMHFGKTREQYNAEGHSARLTE